MLKSVHFADDKTLYLDIKPSTDHSVLIYSKIALNQTWIIENKLSLKVQEAGSMIIPNRNNIGNVYISRIFQHKFQGISIDDKLKFDKYINKLI